MPLVVGTMFVNDLVHHEGDNIVKVHTYIIYALTRKHTEIHTLPHSHPHANTSTHMFKYTRLNTQSARNQLAFKKSVHDWFYI